MIGIATITQNTAGDMIILENPGSRIDDNSVRVSRTATLDGGCVIDHRGFSDADRQFEIEAELTEAETDKLNDIFTDETFVWVAARHGFYKGVISRLWLNGGQVRMTVLIKEKLSS